MYCLSCRHTFGSLAPVQAHAIRCYEGILFFTFVYCSFASRRVADTLNGWSPRRTRVEGSFFDRPGVESAYVTSNGLAHIPRGSFAHLPEIFVLARSGSELARAIPVTTLQHGPSLPYPSRETSSTSSYCYFQGPRQAFFRSLWNL